MSENKESKKTIEEMLSEVDGIIDELESGEIALEDSFKVYEKGMKLVQTINSRIDKVEKNIIKLESREDDNGI